VRVSTAADFARVARAAKVRKLVAAIDSRQRGLDGLIADELSKWTPAEWSEFAHRNGIHSPSETTVEIVLAILRDRAERSNARTA
jgi:hypothetical protein